jgi:hypothetical protein
MKTVLQSTRFALTGQRSRSVDLCAEGVRFHAARAASPQASRPRPEGSGVAVELDSPKRRNVGPPRPPVPTEISESMGNLHRKLAK